MGPWAQWAHGPGPGRDPGPRADGGGDDGGDGGRIFGQVQPPNPITPRDNISRSGTRPHSDNVMQGAGRPFKKCGKV